MIGVYEYGGTNKGWEYIFTGIIIVHMFLVFILLLNFMVAILS